MACNITGSPAADDYEDSDGDDEDYSCSSWTNDEGELLLDTGVIFLYRSKTEKKCDLFSDTDLIQTLDYLLGSPPYVHI